jgi:prepilin-type N-terminal cleavage/methylation domain-containing protein
MHAEERHAAAKDRGFTLLEVLVALSVLGIVLVSIFKLTGSAVIQHQWSERRLVLALTAEAALNAERLEPGSANETAWPASVMVRVERTAWDEAAANGSGSIIAPPSLDRSLGEDLDWLVVRVSDEAGRSYALAGAVARTPQ